MIKLIIVFIPPNRTDFGCRYVYTWPLGLSSGKYDVGVNFLNNKVMCKRRNVLVKRDKCVTGDILKRQNE
jgi:hypothetical protein